MGFEILRTIPSLRARAIGELKSIGMIGEKGRDVKVKCISLRGGRFSGVPGKTKGKAGAFFGGEEETGQGQQ
jgi:hypothetical protein